MELSGNERPRGGALQVGGVLTEVGHESGKSFTLTYRGQAYILHFGQRWLWGWQTAPDRPRAGRRPPLLKLCAGRRLAGDGLMRP